MSCTWKRRTLGIALVAMLTALGLLAKPFGIVGAAQSSREVDGA